MGTVSTPPRDVMETLTAQMAVMRWPVQVSYINLGLLYFSTKKDQVHILF